jgi:hypothetical protein
MTQAMGARQKGCEALVPNVPPRHPTAHPVLLPKTITACLGTAPSFNSRRVRNLADTNPLPEMMTEEVH